MYFSKLRLTGFKSFIEPTELAIEEGLTGVVGPNGCGKSNLVEALRWVMGETSARQMRGDGMEDVIFGGTDDRPARNIAEVALSIANDDRRAPARFNDSEELEIIRRIEREKGSHYKLNGKDVRARDVQLLFADAATGARSAGLVSQGRIGSIVQAKAADRRILLEEAANIRGLHSRRHEAELRLRAAEHNLERLDDVLKALAGQRAALRRQAGQAQRYRELSQRIRQAEASVLYVRWTATMEQRAETDRRVVEARERVAEAAQTAARAGTALSDTAAELPARRRDEAEAAAGLQRLTLARSELEAEERRNETARSETETRLRQIADDMQRENALLEEAAVTLRRLTGEHDTLAAAGEGEAEARKAGAAALAAANRAAEEAEEAVHRATGEIAVADARQATLERQLRQAGERLERLARQQAELAEQRATLARDSIPQGERDAAETAMTEAAASAGRAEAAVPEARRAREIALAADRAARETVREIEAATAALDAEANGLRRLLVEAGRETDPILDRITVEPGLESALGAALGEDLDAPALDPLDPADAAAATGWRGIAQVQEVAWPDGAQPLSDHVQAPSALQARLARIALVADAATASALQNALAPGVRLVTREGGLWRWDGFVRAQGVPSAAALRLERRNRLAELDDRLARQRDALDAARAEADRAAAELGAREAEVETAVQLRDQTRETLSGARAAAAEIDARIAAIDTRLSALDDSAVRLAGEAEETEDQQQQAKAEIATLPDIDALRGRLQALRAGLSERRAALVDSRSEHDRLVREAEDRQHRLTAVREETRSWNERRQRAEARLGDLHARRSAGEAEIARLAARPDEIAGERERLLALLEAAEARRRDAADALVDAENRQAECDRAARDAERLAGEAREALIRAEAQLQQIDQSLEVERERIRERLDCTPERILQAGGVDPDTQLPDIERTQSVLDRLIAERDGLGPVNLRADTELAELDEQVAGMERERDDLLGAIQRLRRAIAALNREGRDRLLTAFRQVDGHFRTLFKRLFGGGEARLSLTGGDDPLEAGLDIMASPPGKKMQHLSLLSGGEQALTAVALVFAVFLTNPSPICVLDEVDAPLDDSNVDRFCSLLEDIVRQTGTRFLIITHHRMTMARMDRLFGVTMTERGVSQLVSVDLTRAEHLREAS